METQRAYSFDPVTKRKIITGFVLGSTTAITVGLTAISAGIKGKELALLLISSFMGSVVNTIREYIAGQ
jgi:Mg/Co/Ni transporter MgtE